ncbi:DeoR/GlpR family DNA-binding transcription regulator [Kineosporia sp. NBRC 101731]|uniref:DeoR/GlpR family DNA-binding transcription regulator n=1 Tax=Kineosporia sp. NBRC 101731 TaxID=3032199 RepID=UPI0024A07B10|nr:DeoR/GlpR family DNA-binding transcription regulator [Kineosporia sp. NBRC 101731]GLY29804.1 DeoR family transcriptional regulator [Kineosporia sp. NBRC 101731]
MGSHQRQKEILDELHREGRVEVLALAERIGISAITIRRDLDQLAEAGSLRRVRGGAVTTSLRGEGLPFAVRAVDESAVKAQLAQAAVDLIADGEAVAVDSGTTGAAAAAVLAGRRVTAMPFSTQAIATLAASSTVTLLLPGGSVRLPEGTIVGPLAQQTLTGLRFDTTILTCCAAAPAAGVTAYDLEDAAIKRALRAAAERTILIAEGAKFTRSALAVVCALEEVDILVTDASAPAEVLASLRDAGVRVVTVSPPTEPQRRH